MLSAGVAELVDALDLGSSDESRGGSSPSARTILRAFSGESLACTRCGSVPLRSERKGLVEGAATSSPLWLASGANYTRYAQIARLSLALLFFRRRSRGSRSRSRGSRSRSFGHPRCCWSHLVCSRRLLNWPALFFNPRRLLSRSAGLFHPGRFRSARLFHPGRLLRSRWLLDGPSLFFSCWSRSLIWPRLGFSWRLGGSWLLTRHRPVHSRARPLGAIRRRLAGSGGDGSMRSVRYACPLENSGARGCCHRGLAMVLLGEERAILARCLYVLSLHRRRLYVTLSGDRLLLWRRPRRGAPVAAIETDIVASVIHHHRLIIDVGNVHVFNVVDRAVVKEVAVIPAAAPIAFTGVTETVVNSAVNPTSRPQ